MFLELFLGLQTIPGYHGYHNLTLAIDIPISDLKSWLGKNRLGPGAGYPLVI